MKTTIFLFHPHLAHSRINAALVNQAPVEVRKLYQLYPTETIDITAEQAALSAAERIVWQFPLYWYSGPSLMKKWLDQVLTAGWAYDGGTALQGKELLLTTTMGGKLADYQPTGAQGHTVAEFLLPLTVTGEYVGMKLLPPFIVDNTVDITDSQLAAAAQRYHQLLLTP
ncbi:NAD(P)H-dependent oxidoreductase [Limosilactobacillus ingluviei]|uniref:NAD(P)H-dependent oxidoreductase n=1 Tax=Limosilactobacillus ingluviei TaxID=148604 RepID=UPI001956BC5B|nr:NAD(P)H-dependent oxidoreductase [Limosilactobacillus ingluviei]MBM6727934.1 NAD(P)H-dependent oxidoreductase [Limosilactobacillus ingluviei]